MIHNAPEGELARRVRAAMSYAGITERELADCIGVSRATVSRTVAASRTPRRGELRDIAEVCGVPFAFFTADWALLDQRPDVGRDDLEELQRAVQALQRAAALRDEEEPRRRPA